MHIYKDQCIGTALFRGKCDPQNYNKIKKKKLYSMVQVTY